MENFGTLLIILVVVLVSMVLHELAHGVVAYWLGDNTAKDDGRLTLNPFKHLDPVLSFLVPIVMFIGGGPIFGGAKPVPVDSSKLKYGPWGMALVAIAGPLTNILLAFVSYLVGVGLGLIGPGGSYYVNNIWSIVAAQMVMVNLGFGIFNLIPIPPLDGSRVLYAIAPDPVRDVMEKMEGFGLIIVMALVILVPGFISNIMGGAISGILTSFDWVASGVFH